MIVARTAVGKKVEVKIWRDKKEIVKIVTLGRLETSEDFKVSEKSESPKETEIKDLKITVRQINKEDIKSRNSRTKQWRGHWEFKNSSKTINQRGYKK